MFLVAEDLTTNNLSTEQIDQIIAETELLFCGLLPLEIKDRDISRSRDEIIYIDGWNKTDTYLLNVLGVKQGITTLTIKTTGMYKGQILFKETPLFDPYCDLIVNSGYDESTLPRDIKYAMIKVAQDKVNSTTLGLGDNIVSYKLGPREVKFSDPGTLSIVKDLLSKYMYC